MPTTTSRWLLPISEAAKGIGMSRSTTYELVARGELEVVHIGRRALIPVSSVDAFVERLRAEQRDGAPAA